jgi:hypothetical protein
VGVAGGVLLVELIVHGACQALARAEAGAGRAFKEAAGIARELHAALEHARDGGHLCRSRARVLFDGLSA